MSSTTTTLFLERLVVLEKAADDREPVLRQLVHVVVGVVLGIVHGHGDDFIVELVLVHHGHQADRAAP